MRASLVLKRTAPLFSRFTAYVTDAVEDCRHELRAQKSIRHLRELPDYLLHDIGLDYSEITAVVRQGPNDTSRRRQGGTDDRR